MPLRTIARITALRPGQSPPPVRTPNRMRRATYIQALTLLACSLLAAGCGSSSDRARGTTLTVYLSLPSHGVSARMAGDVAAGGPARARGRRCARGRQAHPPDATRQLEARSRELGPVARGGEREAGGKRPDR